MGNIYKNVKLDLSANTATTLYTSPTATVGIFSSIIVSNDSGSADTITLTITNVSNAVFSLFKVLPVAANTSIELLTKSFVVNEGEILKVTAATADRLHVVGSFLEIN
tara:strand:+ start:661 stop:984 length:324 start_codon:yes stop_codon:yes gene_type:complete